MSNRSNALQRIQEKQFDAIVVGGGINGAISALALSAHGLSVALIERGDFASGTSQHSSNLVWGGFKYLSNYEFLYVSGLCKSRNRMAKAFPSRMVEKRFFAALDKSSPYPPWFAAMGANVYWALGRFATQRPFFRSLKSIKRLEPSIDATTVRGGIEYSDSMLLDNDSRFVSEFILEAEVKGAVVANYLELEAATRTQDQWTLDLVDNLTNEALTAKCGLLINAAGPNVVPMGSELDAQPKARTVFSKGVHFIVPQITDSGRIIAFYDDSQRLFYVFPMGHRSVVGTTDTSTEDYAEPVSDEDRRFVLEQINKRLALEPLTEEDIIAERCGVRTLVLEGDESVGDKDWTDLSRKHVLDVDPAKGVISILGGKLSDCLNIGEEIVDAVAELGLSPATSTEGWFGEPSESEAKAFMRRASRVGLDRKNTFDTAPTFAATLWRRHGLRANKILDLVEKDPSLGLSFSDLTDMCEAEVIVMRDHEKIETIEDFLRRRTQLAQLNRPADLASDEGMQKAAEILLGDRGRVELKEFGSGGQGRPAGHDDEPRNV